jgi:hypothetical protein
MAKMAKMAEIHLKMVEYAQFKFDHLFFRISFNLVEIRSMASLFAPIRVKIDRFGKISTSFSVSSTKNGGRI